MADTDVQRVAPTRPLRPVAVGPQQAVYDVVFEAESGIGKAFDVALFTLIIGSVLAVCLESVQSIHDSHGTTLYAIEWVFTAIFTAEYLLRLWCVRKPLRYVFSFYGLVDLLSIVPTWAGLFMTAHVEGLLVIRALRLLRIFRVLKMGRYISEGGLLIRALRASRRKIIVFLAAVLSAVSIIGAVMYLVEGQVEGSGFTSIPKSMYWAIVTLTTVGYGDISPQTVLGQVLASAVMILGYGIIAVPTGIVTVELAEAAKEEFRRNGRTCEACGHRQVEHGALFCSRCGTQLPD